MATAAQSEKALVERPPPQNTAIPGFNFEPRSWEELYWLSGQLVDSGMLPASYTKRSHVVAVAMKGVDLGLTIWQAVSGMSLIEGKVALHADLQLALMLREGVSVTWLESTDQRASVRLERQGRAPLVVTWTMEEAIRANLPREINGKPNAWLKYPADMLAARVLSRGARRYCPDVMYGCYTPDEIAEIQGRPGDVEDAPPDLPRAVTAEPVVTEARASQPAAQAVVETVVARDGVPETQENHAAREAALAKAAEETPPPAGNASTTGPTPGVTQPDFTARAVVRRALKAATTEAEVAAVKEVQIDKLRPVDRDEVIGDYKKHLERCQRKDTAKAKAKPKEPEPAPVSPPNQASPSPTPAEPRTPPLGEWVEHGAAVEGVVVRTLATPSAPPREPGDDADELPLLDSAPKVVADERPPVGVGPPEDPAAKARDWVEIAKGWWQDKSPEELRQEAASKYVDMLRNQAKGQKRLEAFDDALRKHVTSWKPPLKRAPL